MTDYSELFFALIKQPVIQAILYVIGSLAAAKIADWIITTILSRLANRTSSTIDDRIIQILHRPIYYSILFMGLGISVHLFQMPEVITFVLKGLFKTIVVISGPLPCSIPSFILLPGMAARAKMTVLSRFIPCP